jgi:hypothetical protein
LERWVRGTRKVEKQWLRILTVLHNKIYRDLHRSSSIVTIVKHKRLGWAGNVDRMRPMDVYKILENNQLENLEEAGRITLRHSLAT